MAGEVTPLLPSTGLTHLEYGIEDDVPVTFTGFDDKQSRPMRDFLSPMLHAPGEKRGKCMCCFWRRWVCVTTISAAIVLPLIAVVLILRYAYLPSFMADQIHKVRCPFLVHVIVASVRPASLLHAYFSVSASRVCAVSGVGVGTCLQSLVSFLAMACIGPSAIVTPTAIGVPCRQSHTHHSSLLCVLPCIFWPSCGFHRTAVQRPLDFEGVNLTDPGVDTVAMFGRAKMDFPLPSSFSLYLRSDALRVRYFSSSTQQYETAGHFTIPQGTELRKVSRAYTCQSMSTMRCFSY